ncbi:Transcription factor kayak [Temnothorax longispinosus]|uniref:Transcription factor kayak n=1 Tax=Temnothorax longispinosus TaxID=300112 RepID=A0A4S2KI04_9HYME|nr:Transcription factor kayak [Temnothorax longispinosus]
MKLDVSDVLYDSSSVSSDSGASQSSRVSHDFLSSIANTAVLPNNMTQRVPSAGYYDNIIEDHSYTMFSMYPPTTNIADWQLMKEENGMLVSLDGLHSGVPTRTTPTLTPTTLRSIEQTFLELTSESASHSREAGFVPPLETEGLEQKKQHLQDEIESLKHARDELEFILDAHRAVSYTHLDKKQHLQDEIESLKHARDELEFILDAHRAVCRRSLRPSSPLDIKPVIKTDLAVEDQYAAEPVKDDTTVAAATRPNRPNSLPVGLDNNNRLNSLTMFAEPKGRPDTLAFKTVETPSFMKPSMDVAGMPITTPTSGIPFNFESLMEGGTGLTPVSTPLIPSCSTQQRSNLSAVDLSSPDANPPKLVSL